MRYPGVPQLPVIVPRCPRLDPGAPCYVPEQPKSWIWAAVIVGAILMIPERTLSGLSGLSGCRPARSPKPGAAIGDLGAMPYIRKSPGNRLFYMYRAPGARKPKTIAKKSVAKFQKAAAAGKGQVYAVWAKDADSARSKIKRGEGVLADSQQQLFPLRRELVLKAQDPARSEDRLDICLERRGWKPKRVRALQASISEKLTPDMFTGKTGKLTGGEVQLQEDMDKCLMRMKKGLAGETANCGVWQTVYSPDAGAMVARCLKYAPACDPTPNPVPPGGPLRKCVGLKRVKTKKNPQGVMRCSKFAPSITSKACLVEPMPPPPPEPKIDIKRSDVMSLAREMASAENAMQKEAGPYLAREILSRGGIAPHARGRETEEYKGLPLHLKNKKGLTMDEMASEMGLEDESALARMIHEEYPFPGMKTKKRRFKAADFEDAAYRVLEEEAWGGRPPRFAGGAPTLAGPVMTCVEFYKSGRCKKFAPTCSPPGEKCATETAKYEAKPKTRKAPKRKKLKRRKPKKRKPRPYLGPKAEPGEITYHEGGLETAFDAARTMMKDDPLYISRANGGHNIQASRPVNTDWYMIVYPDGDVEEATFHPGDAYRAILPGWIRRRHLWSARTL